ncbi:MAG: protein-export chaperone SecB [Acetobacteraceae bacterium]|nr:protein-export chaperone SecB [Acetobacteraceae bacterium]
MSDQLPPQAPNAGVAPQQIALQLNMQFTKDLSFEVPGAPEIFTTLREQPRVDLQLDVQARKLDAPNGASNIYEIALVVRADAKAQDKTCFIIELTYCGIFTVNVGADVLEPVLLVECPRLLFPFARNILAEVTRDGGFPPVLLQPIDFVALWQSRRANQAPIGNA